MRTESTPEQRAFGLRLANALAGRRRDVGLSQSDLATAAETKLDTLRALEQGRIVSPGFQLVAAIARALTVSLDDLAAELRQPARGRRRGSQ